MAVPKKSTAKTESNIVNNVEVKREIKDTDRVVISNNRNWDLHFVSTETGRDIKIPASVKNWKKLTVAEVEGQIQTDNTFFIGSDGIGNNAAIEIVDKEVRDYLFHFEGNEGDNAIILNLDSVKKLLAIEDKSEFEDYLNKLVVSESDKKMIAPLAIEAGLDDVSSYKVERIKKVSGYNF